MQKKWKKQRENQQNPKNTKTKLKVKKKGKKKERQKGKTWENMDLSTCICFAFILLSRFALCFFLVLQQKKQNKSNKKAHRESKICKTNASGQLHVFHMFFSLFDVPFFAHFFCFRFFLVLKFCFLMFQVFSFFCMVFKFKNHSNELWRRVGSQTTMHVRTNQMLHLCAHRHQENPVTSACLLVVETPCVRKIRTPVFNNLLPNCGWILV